MISAPNNRDEPIRFQHQEKPRTEVQNLLTELPATSRVLDLGCGTGNNAIVFANAGHHVTAVDSDDTSVDHLRSLHLDRLDVVHSTIEAFLDGDSRANDGTGYDVVIAAMVLHFMTPTDGGAALRLSQRATAAAGLNVVTTYLIDPMLGPEYTWQLQPGELRDAYGQSWEVLAYTEKHPFTLSTVRTAPQLRRWLRGRRGYKSARIVARKEASQ